jgi:23S rRNA pseudouridine2605 synthase
MRINKYVALATGLSRRAADKAIQEGRVSLNGKAVRLGDSAISSDKVALDGRPITPAVNTITIMLNKPAGYVVSRDGQGSQTIYDLLPEDYHQLKPIGRLDKDSSGLLLLTNDGELANQLTHPRYAKTKVYQIQLDKPLEPLHQQMINDRGIALEDGLSKLSLQKIEDNGKAWQVTMNEGRNRQIRRTFSALGYTVRKLHRVQFGGYQLDGLALGELKTV